VLLSDEGLKVKDISGRLNRHEHTVRSWIKAYIANGIEALKSKHPPGRPRIKGPEVEKHLYGSRSYERIQDVTKQNPL